MTLLDAGPYCGDSDMIFLCIDSNLCRPEMIVSLVDSVVGVKLTPTQLVMLTHSSLIFAR